jgi:hypothetical protein
MGLSIINGLLCFDSSDGEFKEIQHVGMAICLETELHANFHWSQQFTTIASWQFNWT